MKILVVGATGYSGSRFPPHRPARATPSWAWPVTWTPRPPGS
ncbi:hypothetical protein ACFXBB_03680 [Streptomyces scopuliridis]